MAVRRTVRPPSLLRAGDKNDSRQLGCVQQAASTGPDQRHRQLTKLDNPASHFSYTTHQRHPSMTNKLSCRFCAIARSCPAGSLPRFLEALADRGKRIARPYAQRHLAVVTVESMAVGKVDADPSLRSGTDLAGQARPVVSPTPLSAAVSFCQHRFAEGSRSFSPTSFPTGQVC